MHAGITRRQFLAAASAVPCLRPLWCRAGEAAPARRPNILFFLADDQRNDTLGCAGHRIVRTPVIDRLAAAGVRFDNAFVTTPICAASRASLFTGLAERTHRYTFGTPPVAGTFARASYPMLLRQAGYRTGFFGKYGVDMEVKPEEMFDEFSLQFRPYHLNGRHIDEINTDRAIAFLHSSGNTQPFCLSVCFSSPHGDDGNKTPGQTGHYPVIPAAMDMYRDVKVPLPRLSAPAVFNALPEFLKTAEGRIRFFWCLDTPEKYQKNMQAYFGMISGIDIMIGRVLKTLHEQGLDDNTVIIYTADNGLFMGERGLSGKWNHYEQSLRVPLIICDPRLRAAQRGRVVGPMALNIDLPATVLDYAGVKIPRHYQGFSLAPFVRGGTVGSWRTDFCCEHLMNSKTIPKWEGVRGQRFVYARYFGQTPPYEFLHDLKSDPDELVNLATKGTHKGVLDGMRTRRWQSGRDMV